MPQMLARQSLSMEAWSDVGGGARSPRADEAFLNRPAIRTAPLARIIGLGFRGRLLEPERQQGSQLWIPQIQAAPCDQPDVGSEQDVREKRIPDPKMGRDRAA